MSKKLTKEEFERRGNAKHNFKYTYLNFILVNTKIKGLITCLDHGDFPQRADNHLQGDGCPICSLEKIKNEKELAILIIISNKEKKCIKCNFIKPLSEFGNREDKDDKHRNECKKCQYEYNKSFSKTEVGIETQKKAKKKYKKTDKGKKTEKKYVETDKGKQTTKRAQKKYHQSINGKKKTNKRRREYAKKRREHDPLFKLTGNLRNITNEAFAGNGYAKDSHTYEILGCSYEEAMIHIERLWSSPKNLDDSGNVWMNWKNYGKYNGELYFGWDIDHKIPISTHGGSEKMIYILSKIGNLEPLCSYINRDIKKNKFIICEKTLK